MSKVVAYAAFSASDPLSVTTIERRHTGPNDVLIEIRFCGVCHTDIHYARSDFRQQSYPMVPGHRSPVSSLPSVRRSPSMQSVTASGWAAWSTRAACV